MNQIAVKVDGLTRTYKSGKSHLNAVDNLNFVIKENEFVVFMGPSGAGKSTLINLLAALEKPNKGTILFTDKDITKMSDSGKCDLRRYDLGIVFQFFNLHPGLTVSENIELPLVIAGTSKKNREEKINKVLNLLDMKKRKQHYPYELSGGEQQRTAIARALVMNPKVLLCDEPTGDLDSENGQKVIDLLHNLNKEEKITVIQVTHDESMLRIGDRLIQMEDGKVIGDKILRSEDDFPKYDFFNNNQHKL